MSDSDDMARESDRGRGVAPKDEKRVYSAETPTDSTSFILQSLTRFRSQLTRDQVLQAEQRFDVFPTRGVSYVIEATHIYNPMYLAFEFDPLHLVTVVLKHIIERRREHFFATTLNLSP